MREPAILVEPAPPAPRPLRIAAVTETYPPEVNGVALSARRFVEGLRARGHAVDVIRPAQAGEAAADSPERLLVRGAPIPRYPDLQLGLPAYRALVKRWATQRPDVVHVVTEGPLGWSALRAAAKLRVPVCSDFRTNFHAYSRHYGIGWLRAPILSYLRRFHNRTACTLVPTAALRIELEQAGFRNVRVVARGVDAARFDPMRRDEALRASWGAGPEDLVAACVGRLAPEKNVEALVPALEAMRRRRPGTRLLLVGDGPAREALLPRLPGAHWAGMRSGDDLAAHYASADAFLFPSLTETFGNVTLEAMASGLAIVAFDTAAAGELLVHGRSALLAPLEEPARFVALAAALAESPARARELGAQARLAALQLDWERVTGRLEAILREVAESPA